MTAGSSQNLTDLINMLRQLSPINTLPGSSDDLSRAYMAAQGQQNAAILGQAGQMMGQDQTNQLRLMELMGQSGGAQTDAATRWRQELQAQQDVQGEKLRQEYMQSIGYEPGTGISTLAGRQQVLSENQAQAQNLQRQAELTGNYAGAPTLALQQFQDSQTQAAAARALQLQLARESQGTQQAMQGQQIGATSAENAAQRLGQLQLQREQQLYGASESTQERALRQALQSQQLGSTATQAEAERQLRQALATQQIGATSTENAAERQLRLQLQGGQLGQQESEFARSYLLQQEETRRKQAEQSGFTDAGGLTEAARAARSQEATQRAALAAQLMQSPKDVFRAGAYFRSLRGADPTALGLTGGGVMGFNSASDRAALGLPGTITPDDVARATGGAQTGALTAPGASTALAQGALAGTNLGSQGSTDATGGQNTAATDATGGSAAPPAEPAGAAAPTMAAQPPTDTISSPDDDGQDQPPGTSPGGPVSSTIDGQLGDLGIGAGGTFPRRAPAATGYAPGGPIPYINPKTFQEPAVRRMTADLRRRGQGEATSAARSRASGSAGGNGARPGSAAPSMVEVGPYHFGQHTADGRQQADERFLRGVALLNQRLAPQPGAQPGTQPGGPVDAPLWPSGNDTGTTAPSLQDTSSLGSSSFQAPPSPAAAGSTQPDYGAIGSVDPMNQSMALAQISQMLQGGIGNLGPQALERQSKSQRGAFEGGVQALGLNPDDVAQAYAQTRFNNVGNVLQA
jgi:hypothetical protein